MKTLSIAQLCADRGVAPGATKGAAQHLRGIAGGFAAAGHRVATYATRRPEGPFPVPVHELTHILQGRDSACDVVYERYSLGHLAGLDLARRISATFVLEVNAPLVDEAVAHRASTVQPHDAQIEDRLIHEADLVVTVSTALTRWVNTKRSGPTATVPNGFEPSWFGGPPQCAEPTLAFIGHPKPWHGADRLPGLLRALGERGHHPQMLIIGGGPGTQVIHENANRFGVADQITITGALPPDEASARLRGATIGLAPYPLSDGFYFCPLKIIDYLAAGLPIVSTAQGDIARLVGDAGLVVADPDDDEGLADAIAELLDDPERAGELGASGRQRAHASMTWPHVAANTVEAVRPLLRVSGGVR